MWVRRLVYRATKKLFAQIVLDNENFLIDGYTSYLIAKENNKKYVKVVRTKVKFYICIFGIWWRIPEKWFYSKFASRFWTKIVGVGD